MYKKPLILSSLILALTANAGVWVEKPGCYMLSGTISRYDEEHVFLTIYEGSLSQTLIPIKTERRLLTLPVGTAVELPAWLRKKGPIEKSLAEAAARRIAAVTDGSKRMFEWLGEHKESHCQ